MIINKGLIPVGGLGTRLGLLGEAVTKCFTPVAGIPLILFSIKEMNNAGVKEITIVCSSFQKKYIDDFFFPSKEKRASFDKHRPKSDFLNNVYEQYGDFLSSLKISITEQKNPKGLGHAVWCGKEALNLEKDEAFAVLLPDDIMVSNCGQGVLEQLNAVYQSHPSSNVLAVTQVPLIEASRYGILEGEFKDGIIKAEDFIEKPSNPKSPYACVGAYILQKSIIDELDNIISNEQTGSGGEFQITDAIRKVIGTNPLIGVPFKGERLDAGTLEGLIKTDIKMIELLYGKDFILSILKD